MIKETLDRLAYLCKVVPPQLHALPPEMWSARSAPEKWNKQEILGHLIDSATNNHQRFVRAQFEENPVIGYDQNQWNIRSQYTTFPITHLIDFWTRYNWHLWGLAAEMSPDCLDRVCTTPSPCLS